MRLFSLLSMFIFCFSTAADDKSDLESILNETEKAIEEVRKNEDQETLKSLLHGERKASDLVKEIDKNKNSYMRMGNVKKVSEDVLQVKLPESTEATPNLNKSKKLDPDAFIFVSLSMPKGTLRSLFEYAVSNKDNMNIKFVTRGWKRKEFQLTISRFASLWPNNKDQSQMPQMITHPKLFESMNIDMVPAIAVKVDSGYWGVIKGVNSVELAKYYIDKGDEFGSVRGPMYPIEEPNLIDEIKKAANDYDWSKGVEKAKNSARLAQPTMDLPRATVDESYLVDLTIRSTKEILHPNGQVVVKAGQLVNPLMDMTMSKSYIFFDASDPKQVLVVQEWIATKGSVQLIASRLPSDPVERMVIKEKLGLPIGMLNKLIARRFKLKAVPSIVEQENLLVRVTTKGIY